MPWTSTSSASSSPTTSRVRDRRRRHRALPRRPWRSTSTHAGVDGTGERGDARSRFALDVVELDREIAFAGRFTKHARAIAECVYAVGRESACATLRERAICSIAAHAVDVIAETFVEDASLCVALALKRAIVMNDVGRENEVNVVVGYEATPAGGAAPHAWLEIHGKVLDVCVEGLALAEAARRAQVDYDDEEAMNEHFGEATVRAAAYAPGPRGVRPLTVLNRAVQLGGSAASERRAAYGLTLTPPPSSVKGAAEAVEKAEYFKRVVAADDDDAFLNAAPERIRATYDAIASVRIETVNSQAARLDALKNLS